jgi:methanogenic corrinoid protein MtbC1
MIDLEGLKRAIGDLDEAAVADLLDEFGQSGGEGVDRVLAACQEGMGIVGGKYESGEYYVADLIFAGELMAQAATALKPFFVEGAGGSVGKMLLCTVRGDIHDIGKNILKSLLEADGIEVIDLGVDAEPAAIVGAVREHGTGVLALSGVLTIAIEAMKDTIGALAEAGLRDQVKVIVGGAPITEDFCRVVGADAWSLNAAEGVRICRQWLVGD